MDRTYANQFPADYAPPAAVLAALVAEGWEDTSWGNDACPSFEWGDRVKLWIEHERFDLRDSGAHHRYLVNAIEDGEVAEDQMFAFDNDADVIRWIASRNYNPF